MAETIENGGSGVKIGMHVDANEQAHVHAITRTTTQDALEKGNAYNINTGVIGLTTTSESSVLYFKNDEAPVNGESSFIIDAIAVGIGDGGTQDEKATITVVRNPTAASFSTDVDMKQNRNFGSSNELATTTLVYKGAEGATLTGGDDIAIFFQSGVRGYYPIDIEVPRGSAIGVQINSQTSAGTTDVYAAIIGHRKDGKNK
jgi:hypothetical protein